MRLDLPGGTYCLTDGGFVFYDASTIWRRADLGLFVGVSGLTSGMGDQTTRLI